MTTIQSRRLLEDLISELVEGLDLSSSHAPQVGLHASGVEFDLPVETVLMAGPHGHALYSDLPSTITRSLFDRPIGRLRLNIATQAVEVLP